MAYNESTYRGDSDYCINTTGDCVVGDEVRFERARFTGSFRNAKFAGYDLVTGKIIADSYGKTKQQHTFTLQLGDGTRLLIKGRNLYANGTWRKPWVDESQRSSVADEKHARGSSARQSRAIRLANKLQA